MRGSARSPWLPMVAAFVWLSPAASAVTIDWVTVGDPGNACDPRMSGCHGSVADVYRIGKHEVTNAQYAEFLSAKAASDPLGLYSTDMGTTIWGGIERSGTSGSYTYSLVEGREQMPVTHVSFYDALRFANWMHNGQGGGDTETGAYTLVGGALPANEPIPRNAGATVFIPTDAEWYKAAFYDTGSASYHEYPAWTDTQIVCATPGATPNTANCGSVVGDFTGVGSYTGSASPNGTFDQGGNAQEWADEIPILENRILRGWHLGSPPINLSAGRREYDDPWFENAVIGFRVAGAAPPVGVVENLRVGDSLASYFEWDPAPGGGPYDLARGEVANLSGDASGVQLGPLTCIENDSPDEDSLSSPDTETPAAGAAFFYLVRLAGGPWGFGSEGGERTGSGGCSP